MPVPGKKISIKIPPMVESSEVFLCHYPIANNTDISAKMMGMVMQESRWEMIAIPAATVVSFPYALGITIVFNPRGIAAAQIPQMINVSDGLVI